MEDAATTYLALAEKGPELVRPSPVESPHLTLWNRISQFGVAPMLVFLDGLAVVLGIVLVDVVGRGIGADVPLKKTAAFGVVLLSLFWLAGLYRSRLSLSVLDDLPVIAGRWLAAVAVAVLGQIVWSNAIWQNYIIHWRFMWVPSPSVSARCCCAPSGTPSSAGCAPSASWPTGR
jgi:hypothetical protein